METSYSLDPILDVRVGRIRFRTMIALTTSSADSMLDIINGGGKRSLRDANDPVGHVLRHEAVIVPDDADHRNVDVRENVRWGAENCQRPHNYDEYRHHHKCIWPPQRQSDNPHNSPSWLGRTAITVCDFPREVFLGSSPRDAARMPM